MSYKHFTIKALKKKLGLQIGYEDLFSGRISPVAPSTQLEADVAEGKQFPLLSEKAKSELLIMPVLKELKRLNNGRVNVFSGYPLNVDAEKGLTGFCDFLITKDPLPVEIVSPILAIVEAKNEHIEAGIGQCGAEMYAAYQYNLEDGQSVPRIYGAVTTASEWLFMRLEENILTIDARRYALSELPHILGIFQFALGDV